MARRTLQGLLPRLVQLLRSLLRAGASLVGLITGAQQAFPEISNQRIAATARREIDRHQRLQATLQSNWGAFANTIEALNCPGGTRGFRVGMTVHYTSPDTGLRVEFGHSVAVMPGRRVGDLLTEAYNSVAREARRFGYEIPEIGRFTRGLLASTTIHFIDCI